MPVLSNQIAFASSTLLLVSVVHIKPIVAQGSLACLDADPSSLQTDRWQQGNEQFRRGQFAQALVTYQQLLVKCRQLKDRSGETATLLRIGAVYRSLGQYTSALEAVQQGLEIAQVSDRAAEAEALNELGFIYRRLSQYEKSRERHEQALVIAQEVGDRAVAGEAQHHLGAVHTEVGNYEKAFPLYLQALEIRRELGDRRGEGRTLNNLGILHSRQGNYPQALEFYQQALSIRQELEDQAGIGRILSNLGNLYRRLGKYEQAIDSYQQALAILQRIGDHASVSRTLNGLGTVYEHLSQYPFALESYQQALTFAQAIGDRTGESNALDNIGGVYYSRSQYAQALDWYRQALAIKQDIGDQSGEATVLNNLGGVYTSLGQYAEALELLQRARAVRLQIGDRPGEGRLHSYIGIVNELQGKNLQALAHYQQALQIAQDGDRAGESQALELIGGVNTSLGLSAQALKFYEQALMVAQEIGDRAAEIRLLNGIGAVYVHQDRSEQALRFYQQALTIALAIGDRAGEGVTLNNVAVLSEQQPELAIAFYKQSVNVREGIRQDIKTLPQKLQQSYVDTVAQTYRRLADLLLSQGRLLEAQQVLELLKVQELEDYTQERSERQANVVLLPAEEAILTTYGSLITFGQQVAMCEQSQCQQLSQLRDRRDNLARQYRQAVSSLETEIRDRLSHDEGFIAPENLSRISRNITKAQPGTVLIYPLVLEDKLWLLWATQGRILSKREVAVGRQQLGETVLKFRYLLQDPHSKIEQVQGTAQQLYQWLIAPIEEELDRGETQYLVFALDTVTRYIPMGALFDGEQYLIEKYSMSTILSVELTDTEARLPDPQQSSVLAVGVSEAVAGYAPLPYVQTELDALVREGPDDRGIYSGNQFLNSQFDWRTLRDRLQGQQLLHIATHGEFVPGRRDESYLVLGTGERLPIPEIEVLADYLEDVHLVVLSACETALGGPDHDGIEIAGMSYYFLNGGAKTVMASLWKVNDASTSLLMQRFYRNLSQGAITKAQALRQAQLSLLEGEPLNPEEEFTEAEASFVHPYHWSPFILIGNGL